MVEFFHLYRGLKIQPLKLQIAKKDRKSYQKYEPKTAESGSSVGT